jgi:hypothetical protein
MTKLKIGETFLIKVGEDNVDTLPPSFCIMEKDIGDMFIEGTIRRGKRPRKDEVIVEVVKRPVANKA